MKNKKLILGIVLAVFLVGMALVGFRAASAVNHALRISELLKPMLHADNQSMHVAISADIGGESFELESDISKVTEAGTVYVALAQQESTLYVAENVLFLENGKAFKLGDKLQTGDITYQNLIPQIGALYEVLKVTAEETAQGKIYEVKVTGEQVDDLLAAIALPVAGIEALMLQLTEEKGQLARIAFSGNGVMDGTAVALEVTLSNFRILVPGAYTIPEAVKQSAATVDPEQLFSLTEDLYRLVMAIAPFAKAESIDGTLNLTVDCGPIQLDTQMKLSQLQTSSGQVDPKQLQKLPEILGWLCMEGDIRCTRKDGAYVYTLVLKQQQIQQLARMILPELSRYSDSLTAGNVTVVLEEGAISTMKISIEGKISALIVQLPVAVCAEFRFA